MSAGSPHHLLVVLLVALACHASVLTASWLASRASGVLEWWWLWLVYALASLAGWATHRIGHVCPSRAEWAWTRAGAWQQPRRWWRRWFHAHTYGHHVRAYSFRRFSSELVIASLEPNEPFYYPIFAAALVATLAARGTLACALTMLMLYGVAVGTSRVHDEYHLRSTPLGRFSWFRALRDVHRQHHDLQKSVNYGVVDMSWDMVFGTLDCEA
jgi:Fatty acid hydroxylase superfamily